MLTLPALVAALALAMLSPAAEEPGTAARRSSPRVRPHDGRAATVLLRGIERSSTLRMLVEQLETSDLIVYIEMQPALKQELAGRLTWLTAAGNVRYVRVSLNPALGPETLVSTLGHELQHALEVATAPHIVSEATLEAYYKQHGIHMRSHSSGWDTLAARETGELVRREIADRPISTAVDSVAAFDPASWPTTYRRMRDRFNGR
jgi:hypothetical protein